MKVFQKVLKIIKGTKITGHALRNIQNRINIIKANKEIEEILKDEK